MNNDLAWELVQPALDLIASHAIAPFTPEESLRRFREETDITPGELLTGLEYLKRQIEQLIPAVQADPQPV